MVATPLHSIFESRSTIRREDGGRRLSDLPRIIDGFLATLTNRRLDEAYDQLIDVVDKEADTLFRLVYLNAIDKTRAPFPEYNRAYRKLSEKYVKRKKHDHFWMYTGKLGRWLISGRVRPRKVFGEPTIRVVRNERARGRQIMTFQIEPFPETEDSAYWSSRPDIWARLFQPRRGGTPISNEDDRPMISPAIAFLIDKRLKDKVNRVLWRVMTNG